MPPELELIAKLIGGGSLLSFAGLIWYEQRRARMEQREDRRELAGVLKGLTDEQVALRELLGRLDERTALLAGEFAPSELAEEDTRRHRRRPRSAPFGYPTRARPGDTDEQG